MMETIELFEWKSCYDTGIPEIDTQHRKLVSLINRLAGHVVLRQGDGEMEALFIELEDYVAYHFNCEEDIWHTYLGDTTDEAQHKAYHKHFVRTLRQIRTEGLGGHLEQAAEDALTFLVDWLVSHILNVDRRMVQVLLAVKAGESLESARQHADRFMASDSPEIKSLRKAHGTLAQNILQHAKSADGEKFAWHSGQEVKGEVNKVLSSRSEQSFVQRIQQALGALSGLEGLFSGGGQWFYSETLKVLGVPEGWVGHGDRIWNRPMPTLDKGEVRIVSYCDYLLDQPHGHYFISMVHDDDELGILVLDTITNPPDDEIRRGLLHDIGTLFARAILNEQAQKARCDLQATQAHERQLIGTAASQLSALHALMSSVIHEISQPLTFVSATLQSMRRAHRKGQEIPEEKRGDMIDESLRQIDRIVRIMNYPRAFMAADLIAAATPVCWKQVLDTTLARTRLGDIQVVQQVSRPVPLVPGSDGAFEHAMDSLLQNAIHALGGREDGRIEVSIQPTQIEKRTWLEIRMSDNGCGMTPEVRERCFEPFFSTKPGGFGPGIGLSLVQSVVDGYGGAITVESEPGVGSSFALRFPVLEGHPLDLGQYGHTPTTHRHTEQ